MTILSSRPAPEPKACWNTFKRRGLCALAVLGMVTVLALTAGCGSDDPTPLPPTAEPTTAPPTSTATAQPTAVPSATPTTEPVAPTATKAPPPTTEPAAPADPTDAFFDLGRVLNVNIEIAREDWDTLRHQTRTFEDLVEEIEKYQLSRPFANIYDWFSATVTVDGETHTEVGVRKKGFLGSQSDTKPALKLRFDKYVDGQALGGIIERMTLNNSIQDPSMINTCLALQVFAAAGNPASRCNFATVTVNGKDLGLYVHVEEIKAPMLARHFDSADGNLYEGTISDFTPTHRGTIEKKTNEDANDWSDVDAVVDALLDPSDAWLEALGDIVDLDRFLTFWATEVLVGHWDGYTGDRNNYHFYREPGGKFVFIPWGVDDVFHLKDDPNPFDMISNPPPSVLAYTAIPNRLYNHPDWRLKYANRMKDLLDTVWNEDELLAAVDRMAAIVQRHSLPEAAPAAVADAERVRQFIKKRKAEILADMTPEPPDWPEPEVPALPEGAVESAALILEFEAVFGSNNSANPLEEGKVAVLHSDPGDVLPPLGVIAGAATPDEQNILPGVGNLASIAFLGYALDTNSIDGLTIVLPRELLADGTVLQRGDVRIGGVMWSFASGAVEPAWVVPLTDGRLELEIAGDEPGAVIRGRLYAAAGGLPLPGPSGDGIDAVDDGDAAPAKLVINEVAAKGDPLDWFELYNASDAHVALANYVVADDLADPTKRVPFLADWVIPPGGYFLVELDKDAWPGFALGTDEALGIWTADGVLVAQADWEEGQSGEGMSFARVPDATGEFQTVGNPTPGTENQPDN